MTSTVLTPGYFESSVFEYGGTTKESRKQQLKNFCFERKVSRNLSSTKRQAIGYEFYIFLVIYIIIIGHFELNQLKNLLTMISDNRCWFESSLIIPCI